MTVLASLAAGAGAAAVTWAGLRRLYARPALARANYRGHSVPTAAGAVLALALVEVEGARTLAGSPPGAARLATLLAACGFCALGAVDDVAGSGDHRGFAGHLGALRSGTVTTGMLKLVGGGAVALAAAAAVTRQGTAQVVADAALVALCANLGNLLDRAPGRCVKVSLAGFAVLVAAAGARPELAGVAVLAGGAAVLLVGDLRERLMLGDAGANLLGAVVGLGAVLVAPPPARLLVLAGAALLNLAGEVVSFSRVIEAVPPLRALDRAGRLPTWRPSG